MICPRCAKEKPGTHTCKPSAYVGKIEAERDALKEQLKERGSIYTSDDYTVWGSSDSINKLTDNLDRLEAERDRYREALEESIGELEGISQMHSDDCEDYNYAARCGARMGRAALEGK